MLRLLERVWLMLPPAARRRVLFATNPKFLVGVVGVVLDAEGKVLVLEHRFRVPYRWGLPGGHLHVEELPQRALEREIFEETGLVIEAYPELLNLEQNLRGRYFSIALMGRVRSGALKLTSEIAGGGFFPPDALPEGMDPYQGAIVAAWARKNTDGQTRDPILGWRDAR